MTASLDRFSKATRQSKSDIARDAMREYLARHGIDAEYQDQVRAIAAHSSEAELADVDAVHDDLMANQPDYGLGQPRTMERGYVVIGGAPGEFTTKARPYVVIQSDETVGNSHTVSLCPITTQLSGQHPVRIPDDADAANGLRQTSEIAVDLATTMRKSRVLEDIGALPPIVMVRIDVALRRWLAL